MTFEMHYRPGETGRVGLSHYIPYDYVKTWKIKYVFMNRNSDKDCINILGECIFGLYLQLGWKDWEKLNFKDGICSQTYKRDELLFG